MDREAMLQGVYVIVPTPFDRQGAVDEAGLRQLTEFVCGTGVDGLTILGILGEAGKLGEAERRVVIERTIDAVAGRVPVCVGVTHAATDRALAYSREAADLGASAVMAGPPALMRTNEVALRRHYETLAGGIDLPIVVQDFPPSSGIHLPVAFLARLARDVPACRWIKLEDEPTAPKLGAIVEAEPSARIFGGLGASFLYEELVRGAVGTMTGFGFPEILVEIVRRFRAGDREGAAAVFYRYLPLIRFENQPGLNLPLRKHLYHLRGAIPHPAPRLPAVPLDAGTVAELREVLRRLALPVPGVLPPGTIA